MINSTEYFLLQEAFQYYINKYNVEEDCNILERPVENVLEFLNLILQQSYYNK
jgi:hypothetical protein